MIFEVYLNSGEGFELVSQTDALRGWGSKKWVKWKHTLPDPATVVGIREGKLHQEA
jgi:hypothetical protein